MILNDLNILTEEIVILKILVNLKILISLYSLRAEMEILRLKPHEEEAGTYLDSEALPWQPFLMKAEHSSEHMCLHLSDMNLKYYEF